MFHSYSNKSKEINRSYKMTAVSFNEKAYCKMIAHAAKYPHCTLNGILLAKSSTINSKEVEFVDAIPLFHMCINLIPMAEIALMQIDEYASKKGLVIAGYYTAPENIKWYSFDKLSSNKIMDKIGANSSQAFMTIVTGTITNLQAGEDTLKVAQLLDGNFKHCDQIKISNDAINSCMSILERGSFSRVIDFDNHLDNINSDWTNKEFEILLQ